MSDGRKAREFYFDDGLLRDENGYAWMALISDAGVPDFKEGHFREVLKTESRKPEGLSLNHPCKNSCSGWQQGFKKGEANAWREAYEFLRHLAEKGHTNGWYDLHNEAKRRKFF